MKTKVEDRKVEAISAVELNEYISRQFIISVCTKDGTKYKPTSLRSLTASFERYLRKRAILPGSIINHLVFWRKPEKFFNPSKTAKEARKRESINPINASVALTRDVRRDVTKTENGNGEWGMGNGEWGMGNGEWGMGNGEWGMGNGEWGMGNGEWGMGNGEWGMGNGEWGMGNGEWRMGNGEWGMGNEEWGMGKEKIPPAFCTQRLKKMWVLIIAA